MDELARFDAAVEAALGEPLETRMQDVADAVRRGDGECTRSVESTIAVAIRLGYHAVIAETWKPNDT